jgi:S1-C subfamily serine protease
MKKTSIVCLLSALAGALIATAVSEIPLRPPVVAQEFNRGRPRPATLPKPAAALPEQTEGNAAKLRLPALTIDTSPDESLTAEERVNVAVYENVNRSVVNINTKGMRGETFLLIEIPSEGAGSGSVLDKAGHILTNYHVVEGAREIQVTLFDGSNHPAELVGEDPSTDIAVIRIEAPPASLYPVTLGDSTRLKVGQRVFAIGNPFGLERTLTTGIISSLNRSLPSRNGRTIKSIIQIDAAINPGNSGGPLLDTHSRLIGMNTAIASRTGQNTGVGFAISVTSIARVVPQLIEKGRVIRPEIGITRVYETERGLLIAAMASGGPAEKAGLRGPRLVHERRRQGPFVYDYQNVDRSAADLIVDVDGKKIKSADEFLSIIESKQPGDEVIVTVVRDKQEVRVGVRLGESAE